MSFVLRGAPSTREVAGSIFGEVLLLIGLFGWSVRREVVSITIDIEVTDLRALVSLAATRLVSYYYAHFLFRAEISLVGGYTTPPTTA